MTLLIQGFRQREILVDIYSRLMSTFIMNPENIPLMFYLAVLSYVVKTPKHSLELFSMMESCYELNFADRGYVLIDYYYTRALTFHRKFITTT